MNPLRVSDTRISTLFLVCKNSPCRNFHTSSTATKRRLYRRIWFAWRRRGWTACASISTRRRASTRSSAPSSRTPTNWRRSRNANICVSDCSAETSNGTCTTSYRKWPFRQWMPSFTEKSRTPKLRYGRQRAAFGSYSVLVNALSLGFFCLWDV